MTVATASIALALVFGPRARAQPRPITGPLPQPLDAYVRAARETGRIPGLAIAVVRGDTTITAAYGVRELGTPGAVDERTIFDVASLGKSFTATAVAMLVDAGIVRWDDPVSRHLPALRLATPELTTSLTYRDFLSHRTGLAAPNMQWVLTAIDRDEVIRRMQYVPVAAARGQRLIYSNIGYTVAGVAAAAAAKTTFDALLRDRLLRPLGLTSTAWSYEQAATMPNVATSHATVAAKQVAIARETQRASIGPAASIQTSAVDLARWMRLHLNNGVLDGKRFVSDSTMREMHRMQVILSTTPEMRAARNVRDSAGYGLGWQVMDYRGHPLLWHGGNGNGQIAYMALLPDDRLGVAVLVNTWSAPAVHTALASRIIDFYLGFAERDWAGEAFARIPAQDSARAASERAMIAMRSSAPPPAPLAAYAGRYEHPLFGPVWIRLAPSGLTLQMGDGRIADLEYHGADAFYVVWRDPFFRQTYGTHVSFTMSGDSVASLTTTMNRDEFTAAKAVAPPPLVIKGLTIIDMVEGRPRPNISLLVESGRITRMGSTNALRAPAGTQVLDFAGRYAIPGLIDAHVHLTAPFERRGQQDSIAAFLLRGGITAIRDMAGDARVLRERARAAPTDSVESPRIFYSALVASPNFFRTDRRAPGAARDTVPGKVAWVRSIAADSDVVLAARGADSIGATGLKAYAELTPSLLAALTRAAHQRGLKMWSHAAVIPAKPSDAVAAGVDVLSHAFMLMLEDVDSVATTYIGGLDQHVVAKHPVTSPVYARLLAEMARRGTMLDPSLYAINRYAQSRAVLEGDMAFMQGVGEWGIAISKLAHKAGIRFVAGTDVSGLPGQNALPTLHDELQLFVERVGMTPAEALATATRNAAEALGALRDLGTIEVGKLADLVILDANPLEDIRNTRRIVAVLKGGQLFRP